MTDTSFSELEAGSDPSFDLATLANGLDLEGLQIISATSSLAMPEGGASCCGGGSGMSCCCTCCCG